MGGVLYTKVNTIQILYSSLTNSQCYLAYKIQTSEENIYRETYAVKPVLSGHSKRTPKIGFQYRLSRNASQKYCRMLQGEHSAMRST